MSSYLSAPGSTILPSPPRATYTFMVYLPRTDSESAGNGGHLSFCMA